MTAYFGVVDYIVFVAMLLVSIGIGVFFGIKGRRSENTEQYLMGDRKLSLIPVSLSITVSLLSTNTLLGSPAEIYNYGIMYFFTFFGGIVAAVLTSYFYVPLFYPLKLVSVNQYLELRFNSKSIRYLGSVLFLLNSTFYVGTVIYGPATALNIVTGTPPWTSILIVSVIGTLYTSIGGMKAVIWADAFQSIVMVGGMLAISIMGSKEVGGISKVWEINEDWGRMHLDTTVDLTTRFTMASVTIGYFFYWMPKFAVNQPCVQRYCAMETPLKGKLSILLNLPPFFVFHVLSIMTGMVAFAYYASKGCDPMKAGYVTNPNQIVPYFTMEVLSFPGLTGIFMSSVFCASLSTLSSSINSMSAVFWEDILKQRFDHLPPQKQAFVTKIMAALFGTVCTSICFLVLYVGGNLIQLSGSFNGATLGPMLGLFLMGPLMPWVNWKGALTGGLTALTFALWLMFGQVMSKLQRTPLPSDTSSCDQVFGNGTSSIWNGTSESPAFDFTASSTGSTDIYTTTEPSSILRQFYSISFSWFTMINMAIVLVVGTIVSLATGPEKYSEIDPIYLFPFIRKRSREAKNDYKKIHIEQLTHENGSIPLDSCDVTKT